MSFERLSIEQQQRILEDLCCIITAQRREQLVLLRSQRLREHRPPSPWEQVDVDHLAREAATLVGGEPSEWREAVEAYLGIPSKSDVCIEAVREMAEVTRAEEQQRQEERPRSRVNVGRRKRGGR